MPANYDRARASVNSDYSTLPISTLKRRAELAANATPIASVNLPEVVVVAKRESTGSYFAIASELPEVVVVATRIASMVAQAGTTPQGHSAAAQGSVEGALLK